MELGLFVEANAGGAFSAPCTPERGSGPVLSGGQVLNGANAGGMVMPTALAPFAQETGLRPLVKGFGETPSGVALSILPEAERALANEKADFVRLVLETAKAGGLSHQLAAGVVATRTELFPLLRKSGNGGKSLIGGDKAYFNFRQWKGRLEIAGQVDTSRVALAARNYARGRRITTPGADHPFIRLVAGFYENENRLDLAEAYSLACGVAKHEKFHSEMLLSDNQVKYYYQKVKDPQALLLARHGEEWFRNNVAGFIDRDWSRVPVGYIWVGDHHQFDAPCKFFDEHENKFKSCRPWLTAWLDNRALFFTGWVIRAGEHPDSFAIEDALLEGIRNNGNMPPQVAYTDNGKDYLSKGFAEPVEIEVDGKKYQFSILQALGIRPLTAIAYNARAKVIERMFKEVAGKFARYWFAYLGNRPGNRPDRANDAWNQPESLPSLQEFCEAFSWWLQNQFHEHAGEHSKITGGKTPAMMWAERKPLRDALADEQLRMAFLKPWARNPLVTVGRGGRLQVDGLTYQSGSLWPEVGNKVLVKIDRLDPRHVYAFRPDGSQPIEIPVVQTVPALAETPEERQQISDGMAAVRRQLTRARTIQREDMGGTRTVMAPMARLQLSDPAFVPPSADSAIRNPQSAIAPAAPVSSAIRAAMEKTLFGAGDITAATPDQAGADVDAVNLKDALANLEM